MHLLEQYALACGVKIDQPFVETNYFPLPFSDYIIIHPASGMDAKNYDYYADVIELIYPLLQKNNIEIVQIGTKEDKILPHCYAVNGNTSLGQSFFLIKNSLLLLGNDSFSSHVAGGFDVKLVSLYSNLYKECCKPYWGSPDNQILIQADRNGKKPSYAAQEEVKAVNNIKPEKIANSILSLLDIKSPLNLYETLHVGSYYQQSAVEVIPNFFNPNIIPRENGINLRLDYHFDLETASQWMFTYKTHLIINRQVDPKYFTVIRNNLAKISVELSKEIEPEYIDVLKNLGCEIELFAPEDENLVKTRLDFIDWGVDKLEFGAKKDLDCVEKICDNTCYKSSKTILSNEKTYSSKAAWMAKQERRTNEPIIDNEDFWKELMYFRIYNTASHVSTKKS